MSYRVPSRLARVVWEEAPAGPLVYLLRLPDGPPLRLDGTAALIWLLAADGEPDVVAALAGLVGEAPEAVRAATVDYLTYLEETGLLVRDERGAP